MPRQKTSVFPGLLSFSQFGGRLIEEYSTDRLGIFSTNGKLALRMAWNILTELAIAPMARF
jgi:hypothetical protein